MKNNFERRSSSDYNSEFKAYLPTAYKQLTDLKQMANLWFQFLSLQQIEGQVLLDFLITTVTQTANIYVCPVKY